MNKMCKNIEVQTFHIVHVVPHVHQINDDWLSPIVTNYKTCTGNYKIHAYTVYCTVHSDRTVHGIPLLGM